MTQSAELRRRLQRLGRRRPGEALVPPRLEAEVSAGEMLAGEEVPTPSGSAFRRQATYPADYLHGRRPLGRLFDFDSRLAADLARQPGLGEIAYDRLLFLDTETTGLAGGAGTLVFLVGLGRFTPEGFRLRQYFLRDPAEEAGMLRALVEDLEETSGFVTFNGRAFDLPLLEMRYGIGLRRRWPLSARPHFDLLFPSRRLWRRALPDCTLGTLEAELLGVERTEQDVPGALIPGLYLEYLRSGDTTAMARVLYHNAVDVLTLVGLASTVLERHQMPGEALTSSEALAVARWHAEQGRLQAAESALRHAMDEGRGLERQEALRAFTSLLRSQRRRGHALEALAAWSELSPDNPEPCLEAAKYYEWEARDLDQALQWADRARQAVERWPDGWRRREALAAIDHRISRLLVKQATRTAPLVA